MLSWRGIFWLIVLAGIVVWQVGQAIAIGVLGIPGVYTVALVADAAKPAAGPARRPAAIPKQAYRKRVEPAPGPRTVAEDKRVTRLPPATKPPSAAALPSPAKLERWLRSTAREFVGGVDAQGNMLYRFEVWLEAPKEVGRRLVEVAYDYDAPSVQPGRRQSSKKRKDGFRVRFGALICARSLTLTLTYEDGRTQQLTVDGCSIL